MFKQPEFFKNKELSLWHLLIDSTLQYYCGFIIRSAADLLCGSMAIRQVVYNYVAAVIKERVF